MKTKLIWLVVSCVIVVALLPASCAPAVTVPDDYPTIQAAVDAASDGDTIIVRDGTYAENVDIDKSLTIQSRNGAEATIVAASSWDDYVFCVTADNVVISGFTVKGATGVEKAGIYLDDGDYCIISKNRVYLNQYGIYLDSANNNTLENNECYSNSSEGIFLWSSCNNNTIDNNTCYRNRVHGGIYLRKSCSNNSITNNNCYRNYGHGIKILEFSNSNILENNTCSNNAIEGIHVRRGCKYNSIINNTCLNNGTGIGIFSSSNNSIGNNSCSSNYMFGIAVMIPPEHPEYGPSNGNVVTNNTCSKNG